MKTPSNQVLLVLLGAITFAVSGCGQEKSQFDDVAAAIERTDEQQPDSDATNVDSSNQLPTTQNDEPANETMANNKPPDELTNDLPNFGPRSSQAYSEQPEIWDKSVAPSMNLDISELNPQPEGYAEVKVFYGTDREPVITRLDSIGKVLSTFATVIISAVFAVLFFVATRFFTSGRIVFGALAVVSVAASLFLANETLHRLNRQRIAAERDSIYYGSARGELEYGVAKVSIPATHEMGRLEAPSILRLEFKEDPTKHVVLLNVTSRSEDEFFTELGDKLRESSESELFVFVHGFNLTFEDAVRRTAQIAYDMEFAGAPITYSWPSQGSILGYTADEESIKYTTEHLKEFILKLKSNNPTASINLVAHSMGNRAMTVVLKEIALAQSQTVPPKKMFNEVVLAAPDVDADVFKQRVLSKPSIMNVANRVTLYASSNDKALLMSKKVHGFRRAGESGEGLVVIPGVDTIDVSQIDLSILGHNYYGDSQAIIRDLRHAIILREKAGERHWLRAMDFADNLKYWSYPNFDAPPVETP